MRSHVKVLIHDEQLASAAATIANITPGMLTLQNVNSLMRPLVVEHCRRYYNRVGSKKLAKKNIPTIPQNIRLLLDIVVPEFLLSEYYCRTNREMKSSDNDGACSSTLDSELSKAEQLPGPPTNPVYVGEIAMKKGSGGNKAIPVEEHLIEWISFTLAHWNFIRQFGLKELEKWEKKGNKGGGDGREGKSDDEDVKSENDFKVMHKLMGELRKTESVRQFFLTDAEETLLMVKKDHLAPLFDLYDHLHGKGLRKQTVSGFVSRLQQLKVKYSQQKEEEEIADGTEKKNDISPINHWPAWAGQLFEQIQAEITADLSFCGYQKKLKEMKLTHEQEESEKKKKEMVENCPIEITSTPPLHQLLDTVPLITYDFSHLPTFFALELENMAVIEEKAENEKHLSGYSHVMSFISFNKQWFEPTVPQFFEMPTEANNGSKVEDLDKLSKKVEIENKMPKMPETGMVVDVKKLKNHQKIKKKMPSTTQKQSFVIHLDKLDQNGMPTIEERVEEFMIFPGKSIKSDWYEMKNPAFKENEKLSITDWDKLQIHQEIDLMLDNLSLACEDNYSKNSLPHI